MKSCDLLPHSVQVCGASVRAVFCDHIFVSFITVIIVINCAVLLTMGFNYKGCHDGYSLGLMDIPLVCFKTVNPCMSTFSAMLELPNSNENNNKQALDISKL